MGSAAESLATDQRTALLAAQNAEYFRQIAEVRTHGSGFEVTRNLFGFKSGSGGKIGKAIARGLEKSGILSSDRMFICGIAAAVDILRISGGTSSALANDKCHRIAVCERSIANGCGKEISVSEKRDAFGVQNIGELRKEMANNQPSGKPERSKITENGELKI